MRLAPQSSCSHVRRAAEGELSAPLYLLCPPGARSKPEREGRVTSRSEHSPSQRCLRGSALN